jgi:hypothetical protein
MDAEVGASALRFPHREPPPHGLHQQLGHRQADAAATRINRGRPPYEALEDRIPLRLRHAWTVVAHMQNHLTVSQFP